MTAKNDASFDMTALGSKGAHSETARSPSVPHNNFTAVSKVPDSEPECFKDWRNEKTDEVLESCKSQGLATSLLLARGGTIYQNLQEAPKLSSEAVATRVLSESGQGNPPQAYALQYPPPSRVASCGGKVKLAAIVFAVLFLATAFLALLVLSVTSYARINQFATRVKNMEELSERIVKDIDMYNKSITHENFVAMASKLNATVTTLESLGTELSILKSMGIFQLLSSYEGMAAQISNCHTELHFVNETHVSTLSQLNAVNSGLSLLSVRVDTLLLPQLSVLQSMQDVVQSELDSLSNRLNKTGTKVDTISSRVSEDQFQLDIIREKYSSLVTQLNVTSTSMESLKHNVTVEHSLLTTISAGLNITQANLTLLASDVSQLQLIMDVTNTRVNRAQNNITSMRSDQNITRQSLNAVKTSLNSIGSRFSSMSRVVRSLNSTVASPMSFYSRCYKDVVNCTVSLHQFTPFWYRCTTPSLRINAPVSYDTLISNVLPALLMHVYMHTA